jgi:predicted alpha/beta-fold hydrolase
MEDFRPPPLLRNPHVQTVLGSSRLRRHRVLQRAAGMLRVSEDAVIECGGGVRLLVHDAPAPTARPLGVAVLLHGWEGCGNATYVLSAGARLWAAGWRLIRLNLRDHGDTQHLNEGLFHSCRLAEVIGALRRVQERFPDETFVLGGFSLGGNFALRVAARARESGLAIARVAAVCPVLDPADTMYAMDQGPAIYRRHFLARWRRSLLLKQRAFPSLYDFGDLQRFRTLEAMTEYFVLNYAGFPDLHSYLQGYALTGDRMASLTVPARMLLADDDPVIPAAGLARVARPVSLHVDRIGFGGHCAFLANYRLDSLADDYLLAALNR